MKELIHYSIEDLREFYIARMSASYVFYIPLDDDGSETWHPYYEIERRSVATAAMRRALNEHVIDDAARMYL